MDLNSLERTVTVVVLAEANALAFHAIAGIAMWALYRFPAKTPFPDTTYAVAGGRIGRDLQQRRSGLALDSATGLVFLLSLVMLAFGGLSRLPFWPMWWVKWLLILVVVFLAWGYGWITLQALRAYYKARAEWHANLAIGGVLKHFALAGHQVYHDIDANGLNCDHVVVGQKGVFIINVAVRPVPRGAEGSIAKLLPVERQLELGPNKEFEAVFAATRRVTEMSKVIEKVLGHKVRPVSAIVVPGWETAPTVEGDHLLFNASNISSLLSWATPQHGLLKEDLPAITKFFVAAQRVSRPV